MFFISSDFECTARCNGFYDIGSHPDASTLFSEKDELFPAMDSDSLTDFTLATEVEIKKPFS